MRHLYVALASAAIVLPAYAQQGPGSGEQRTPSQSQVQPRQGGEPAATQRQVDPETRQFVEKAAIGDMYEIESSRIALDKASNNAFKELAQRIVDDHTKTSNELKSLARGIQGLRIQEKMDAKHEKMINELRSASDQQFAQLYRNQQIAAHNEAVQLFEQYSKNGKNAELKSFAEKTLAALKEHRQMAQSLPRGAEPQVSQTQGDRSAGQRAQPQSEGQRTTGAPQQRQILSTLTPEHILGTNLRGTKVYGANNENIGEINDIVVNRNGQVVAVVVGVGGFLGIGEKDVAIPFQALEIGQGSATTGAGADRSARPDRIVLRRMTKQELEAAPSFKAQR
jgi:putative membrane protein